MITLPLSEGLLVSFCGLYIVESRNHGVLNSPLRGGGSIASLTSITEYRVTLMQTSNCHRLSFVIYENVLCVCVALYSSPCEQQVMKEL